MARASYSELMGKQPAHLTLKLDTHEPVELLDFVGAFTSLANEFERFVDVAYPGARADPRIYIKEVRSGCIEADMITGLAITSATVLGHIDQVMVLEDFVKRWGSRLRMLITGKVADGDLNTDGELKDFLKTAHSIASDPLASHRLEAATYEDGKRQIRASFEFSSVEARSAEVHIEDRRKMLAKPDSDTVFRVLMVFTRTDVHDAKLNKRSGERVRINDVSPDDKPVMYSSEMAELEIREQIREADDNAYKKGFIVDAAVQRSGDRIVAYSITNFHGTIELDI